MTVYRHRYANNRVYSDKDWRAFQTVNFFIQIYCRALFLASVGNSPTSVNAVRHYRGCRGGATFGA